MRICCLSCDSHWSQAKWDVSTSLTLNSTWVISPQSLVIASVMLIGLRELNKRTKSVLLSSAFKWLRKKIDTCYLNRDNIVSVESYFPFFILFLFRACKRSWGWSDGPSQRRRRVILGSRLEMEPWGLVSAPCCFTSTVCALGDIPKLSVNLRQIVSLPFAAPILDGEWLWVGSLVHNQVLRSLSPFIPCKGPRSFSVLVWWWGFSLND